MTSIDPKLLDVLEQYVADALSEGERIEFEAKLKADDEIADALDFFLTFESEKENFGRILFKEELRKVEAEMSHAPVKHRITNILDTVLQRIANHLNKTIQDVERLFEPVPEYQALLLSTHRSGTLKAKTPTIGKDYTNGFLSFRFEQKKKERDFLILIENNQLEQISERIVEKEEELVLIDVSDYPVGRYYWKVVQLSTDYLKVGDFLVTIPEMS